MSTLAAFSKLPALNAATILIEKAEMNIKAVLDKGEIGERTIIQCGNVSENFTVLVGTNDVFQQQLAETILKEKQNLKVNIHLTTSLPLPAERDHIRPRIDLIVFMVDIQSKYSFKDIEASLVHVDANFFLGKVCFLAMGAGRMHQISVDMNAVLKLADRYCSPILFCELECEKIRIATAQRLLQMMQICAGHVSGISALSFSSLMKSSIDDSSFMA